MTTPPKSHKRLSDEELAAMDESSWREKLSPEEYFVTREQGTERPFSGTYHEFTQVGSYRCKCCGEVLFESGDKFYSACGWPAFSAGKEAAIEEHKDTSHGMIRTEVTCKRCDAHLGHVFPDGPPTTGLRYCINSQAIDFDDE